MSNQNNDIVGELEGDIGVQQHNEFYVCVSATPAR
jgi:hypothetical protein